MADVPRVPGPGVSEPAARGGSGMSDSPLDRDRTPTDAGGSNRLPPIEVASAFIDGHFPRCLAAFLAGSSSRGEATPTSDLDLLIVDPGEPAPRWATFHAMGWPIETFLLSP